MNTEDLFGDVVYAYTRKRAIADGVLVDITGINAISEHWKYPMACTCEVWSIIEATLAVEGQDLDGIANDISQMAKMALRNQRDPNIVWFEVIIVGMVHRLKLHVGPGDQGEPVLTLMLPNQD